MQDLVCYVLYTLYGMFYILDFLLVFVNMLLVVVIFRECFSSESENGFSNHWT